MGIWDTYENRVYVQGKTKREAALFRTSRRLSEKLGDSLSYHGVLIDGEERSVIIDDSDNLNEKIMHSLPGEDFVCGSLVEWADNHWLVTEKDANNELRTRVKLLQCNFLLKFDSIMEMKYYRDVLCPLMESGDVVNVELQKPYELQPKFKHDDKTVHPITYVADFFIEYRDGSQVVIDIKGCPDSVANIKRKLFWYRYPDVDYRWMTLSGIDGGWCSYEHVKQQRAIRKRERLKAKKEKMEEQNNGKSE